MNVLILTPDAVGSTLLQRMLTIYMQFHVFDQPVINLHELTNGLSRYYSPEFNRELVGKKTVQNWGYYQTLPEITELLSGVDHYKTSRLAHYHIRRRGDDVREQIPFYNYLNDNFYIIACQRSNVFEHALSMTINTVTNKLNVYDAYEKVSTFYKIYQSGISLDPKVFANFLDAYKIYIYWSQRYFNIASYFNYEQDIPRLEQYILNLPIFASQPCLVTWEKNFGISFDTWNRCHYHRSDVSSLMLTAGQTPETLLLPHSKDLPAEQQQELLKTVLQQDGIVQWQSQQRQQQLTQYKHSYDQAQQTIDRMIELGIIINGPPIKKQTLLEKRKIIKNFSQLTDVYNDWCQRHSDIAKPVNSSGLDLLCDQEQGYWNSFTDSTVPQLQQPPSQQ